jgi:lipopolysaccharide/colanic/teichoic acid biosynthesis glycosyltransferase
MKHNLFVGQNYQNFLKRIIDILGSIVLLIVFFIPSIIIAIAIKTTTEGPVFADVPSRIGKNGKKFKMYKFRSMIANAHTILRKDPKFKELYQEYKKASYKLHNDPRITDVGRFIRRHSLDELPQLINVLTGDMSLVGPRAYYEDELVNQQKEYPSTKNLVKKVLTAKPGITGLWQVSGRSKVNFDERIILDAKYVEKISLLHDLKIIFKTPIIMLTGRGAV